MLNCISGMVEKTQSAISILQQRQAEVANIRTAEELVAEVQAKANMAILEVKQAALEEIREAKSRQRSEIQNNCKEEVKVAFKVLKSILIIISSPAGTVADRLPRHVQAAAWRDTAVHSASIRTGRITPGCAGQTSPWRITLACTEEWLDLLLPETGQWTLLQGVKCLPDMAERERSSFSTDCDSFVVDSVTLCLKI